MIAELARAAEPDRASGAWEGISLALRKAILAASRSAHFDVRNLGPFLAGNDMESIPWFEFDGPGQPTIELGIFAGIHGDEPSGVFAALELIERLVEEPELGRHYHIVITPACNPAGLRAGCRGNAVGCDLNREFWRRSSQPEVRLIEASLRKRAFHGVIALHSDDASDGMYGFVGGATLTKHLLGPALEAASAFLPVNASSQIDNFPAASGMIETCYHGVLQADPGLCVRPFEIVFETPQLAPLELQVSAFGAALLDILDRYGRILSHARDI